MKRNVKAYKVLVRVNSHGALVLCVVYAIDSAERHHAAEFHLLMDATKLQPSQPQPGNAFSFKDELSTFGSATVGAPTDREHIEVWIVTKIKEVFGINAEVTVSDIGETETP